MYILHVDTDPAMHDLVRRARDRVAGHADVIAADTLRSALCVLSCTPVACIVADVELRDAGGMEVLRRIRTTQPSAPLVVLTARARLAGDLLRALGVQEWLPKSGADATAISLAIGAALGAGALVAAEGGADPGSDTGDCDITQFGGLDFITRSPVMRRILRLVESAAESDVPVLLEGETGTGKEILARALHARSPRRHAPMVVQNCAAVAEALLESELFGHVRGAFTGAERDRTGLFLEAGAGTVFLDEIGEASATVQARLLRVLQHREVKPVGSDRAQRVTARIVAAANRPLADEVRAGRFRADLYYRLTVLPIPVPPLRERNGDVRRLARHFLGRLAADEHRDGIAFSEDALRCLATYHWPGNVRELEHEVHRLVLTVDPHTTIRPEHLAPRIRTHGALPADEPLEDVLARVEIALIRDRLDRFPTKTDAARSLGITREGLYAKLRRLGMLNAAAS